MKGSRKASGRRQSDVAIDSSNELGSPANRGTPLRPVLWPRAVALAIVVVATLIPFFGVTSAEFLNWDDDKNFLSNPFFRGLSVAHGGRR